MKKGKSPGIPSSEYTFNYTNALLKRSLTMPIKEIASFHFYKVVELNKHKNDIKQNLRECYFPLSICFTCEEKQKYKYQ